MQLAGQCMQSAAVGDAVSAAAGGAGIWTVIVVSLLSCGIVLRVCVASRLCSGGGSTSECFGRAVQVPLRVARVQADERDTLWQPLARGQVAWGRGQGHRDVRGWLGLQVISRMYGRTGI